MLRFVYDDGDVALFTLLQICTELRYYIRRNFKKSETFMKFNYLD